MLLKAGINCQLICKIEVYLIRYSNSLIVILIIFLITNLTWLSSKPIRSNIFKKLADSLSKTPSALIERLMKVTDGNFFFGPGLTPYIYLECLRLMLFLRLVSYPTVNSYSIQSIVLRQN